MFAQAPIIDWFISAFGGKSGDRFIIFFISMLPLLELKGGLLAAGPAFLDVDKWRAVPICIAGNLTPIPFILVLITKLFNRMKATGLLRAAAQKIEVKALSKSRNIKKYKFWGLVAFVGIPLPGTGAWSGALIAALLGLPFIKAFAAVMLGVFAAAFIMTLFSYTVVGGIFF